MTKNQIMRGWKLAVDSETNEEDHQRRVKQPEQRRHKEETRRESFDKNKKLQQTSEQWQRQSGCCVCGGFIKT